MEQTFAQKPQDIQVLFGKFALALVMNLWSLSLMGIEEAV